LPVIYPAEIYYCLKFILFLSYYSWYFYLRFLWSQWDFSNNSTRSKIQGKSRQVV